MLTFDFLAPERSGIATGISPSGGTGAATVLVVPMATAAFPMQSGRAVHVHAEGVGLDSAGNAVLDIEDGTMVPGAYTSMRGLSGAFRFSVNVSGDLVVAWSNVNSALSGITQDVAVRVAMRWVG